jgi:hypothetical protein
VNRETGNRVESRYVDAASGKPVEEEDQAKGYEVEDDRFVILEDEELEAVGLESTRTIDIERFVPRHDVSWIWLDRPHLLKPGDKVGEEAFAVIREAMVATGTAAGNGWFCTGVSTRSRLSRAGAGSCFGLCAMGMRCGRRTTTSRRRRRPRRS